MHTDVVRNKPGQSSKYEMNFVKSIKEQIKMEAIKTYPCPMYTDISAANLTNVPNAEWIWLKENCQLIKKPIER